MSQAIHIGQILIEQGVLNQQQVLEILEAQRNKGLPFGVLAERMFDVTLESVERAWAEQYHRSTGTIDLSQQVFERKALKLIKRRQAWQFEIVPIGFERGGELLIAASHRRLARAVTFVSSQLKPIAYFRVAEPDQVREYLRKLYPMPEASQKLLSLAKDLVSPRRVARPSQ